MRGSRDARFIYEGYQNAVKVIIEHLANENKEK